MESRVNLPVLVDIILSCLPFKSHNACLSFFQRDAGQNAHAGTKLVEPLKELLHIAFLILFPVFHPRHEGCFRNIWHNDVGFRAELSILLYIFHIKCRIQLSIVRHHRVDDDLCIIRPEHAEDFLHLINLLYCPQISGVDSIKCHSLVFPMLSDRLNLIRQILASEILEHRMCRQNRCRQNDRLGTEGGNDRQCNG